MTTMNPLFVKRFKSFAWRTVMMVLAFGAAFALENIHLLDLSPAAITVLGLVLGEVSKFLNKEAR